MKGMTSQIESKDATRVRSRRVRGRVSRMYYFNMTVTTFLLRYRNVTVPTVSKALS